MLGSQPLRRASRCGSRLARAAPGWAARASPCAGAASSREPRRGPRAQRSRAPPALGGGAAHPGQAAAAANLPLPACRPDVVEQEYGGLGLPPSPAPGTRPLPPAKLGFSPSSHRRGLHREAPERLPAGGRRTRAPVPGQRRSARRGCSSATSVVSVPTSETPLGYKVPRITPGPYEDRYIQWWSETEGRAAVVTGPNEVPGEGGEGRRLIHETAQKFLKLEI